MKFLLIVTLALVSMFAIAQSVPVESLFEEIDLLSDGSADLLVGHNLEVEGNTGVRQKRVTCDLLSLSTPWGSLNHSACAAHCLALRRKFKGGRCSKGVCRCRK